MSKIPVKSVRRVFEVLALFDTERRPLTAKQVSDKLSYPLVSTHELLKSMHFMGGADFFAPTREYTPSRTLADLIDWTKDFLDRESDILDLLATLNRHSKETVNLSRRSNTITKILHGLETLMPVGVSARVGTEMPTTKTLTGITALACLDAKQFAAFGKQLKRSSPTEFRQLNMDMIMRARKEIQQHGSVAGYDMFIEGIGAVCVPLEAKTTGECLVAGIVGPTERIRTEELAHRELIRKMTHRHCVTILNFA